MGQVGGTVGGGGGGAIAIASSTRIDIAGEVTANGGNGGSPSAGGGSGGAIRLTANEVSGSGVLRAEGSLGGTFIFVPETGVGGKGGLGRIRLEALALTYDGPTLGVRSDGAPGPVFLPTPAKVRIVSVDGVLVGADPSGSLRGTDVAVGVPGTVAVVLNASGLPLGTTVEVTAKPPSGDAIGPATSPGLTGTVEASTATVELDLPSAGQYFLEAEATLQPASP